MPLTPKEMERILLADGWYNDSQKGSHPHYKHPTKPGKVTIPFHTKDLNAKTEHEILKQAQIELPPHKKGGK